MKFFSEFRYRMFAASVGIALVHAPLAATDQERPSFAYPDQAQSAELHDTMYLHNATAVYLWGIPALGFAGIVDGAKAMGVGPRQMYIFDQTVRPNQHLRTPNADIIYGFAYYDLRQGPVIIDLPAGSYLGSILDAWQRPIEDLGTAGRDRWQRRILRDFAARLHRTGSAGCRFRSAIGNQQRLIVLAKLL